VVTLIETDPDELEAKIIFGLARLMPPINDTWTLHPSLIAETSFVTALVWGYTPEGPAV
jgi:hypothetical protein